MRLPVSFPAVGLALVAATATATDYVLTVGGGHSPHSNQVSLEKNALFFGRVLAETLPDAEHTVLFADGDDPRRDVQFIDPDAPLPRVYSLLARVFEETDHIAESYRDHEIPAVAGAATVENLRGWIEAVGSKLGSGDRVILYVTAHGGRSEDKKRPRNTTLYLWDDEEVTVEELSAALDELPPQVPVVVVMVQCFSGGFADLVFEGADAKGRPTPHDRCGFFATTHTRVAAGCTPDIDEADYREYSSAFWAALLGRTRTGEPVEPPDHDGDGVVSFGEAHAYVLIESDTIDVPVKTSDAFLRAYSSERPKAPPVIASRDDAGGGRPTAAETGEPTRVTALRPVAPLTADAPVASLLDVADPSERAVIVGLSERLGLTRPDRAAEAREAAKRTEDERKRLRGRINRLERDYDDARGEIEAAVLAEWPELAGPWNPEARRLVAEQPEAIVGLIESHPRFEEFDRLEAEIVRLEERRLDLERRWAKCQRLLRTLETVVLAHNLPLTADPDLLSRYVRLRAAESETLASLASEP
ncbi:MAG TPA: hypothetical protein VF170_07285 [Planctomycetaceae bacterium]